MSPTSSRLQLAWFSLYSSEAVTSAQVTLQVAGGTLCAGHSALEANPPSLGNVSKGFGDANA